MEKQLCFEIFLWIFFLQTPISVHPKKNLKNHNSFLLHLTLVNSFYVFMTFYAKVDNFANSSFLPEPAEFRPICSWNIKCILILCLFVLPKETDMFEHQIFANKAIIMTSNNNNKKIKLTDEEFA